uniref:Uncharacterized protein n=1 Tax=Theropithecus gelada TaxID=9565 RepID=A0A8D2E3A0_THEGE
PVSGTRLAKCCRWAGCAEALGTRWSNTYSDLFFFFLRRSLALCHPGWSAVARSRLTITPLHSSLGDRARLRLKTNKQTKKLNQSCSV